MTLLKLLKQKKLLKFLQVINPGFLLLFVGIYSGQSFAIAGRQQEVLSAMNGFVQVLDNNESWGQLTPYIDFPDAGVPDCGMFIESYSIHLIQMNKTKANVQVNFRVVGEFAGESYFIYPKPVRRELVYPLGYTDRYWSTLEESGLTSYIFRRNGIYSWKVRRGSIAFMNVRYLDWHMHYYDSQVQKQVIHGFPPKHCWN